MIVLDRLLLGGIRFVLDKVAQAVDAELDDPARLREELLAAQMRFELGELDEAGLARIETDLLARLRELSGEGASQGALSFGDGGIGVDVTLDGDDDER